MSDQWAVRTRTGSTEEGKAIYGREVYAGTEYGARRYVESNHPRPHVEPGVAPRGEEGPAYDAVLVAPDGIEEVYHADPEIGWNARGGGKTPVSEPKTPKKPTP